MLTSIYKIEETNKKSIPKAIGLSGDSIPFSIFLVDDDIMFLWSLKHRLQHKLSRTVKNAIS